MQATLWWGRDDLRSLPAGGRGGRTLRRGLGQLDLSAPSGAAGIYSFKLTANWVLGDPSRPTACSTSLQDPIFLSVSKLLLPGPWVGGAPRVSTALMV